MGKLWDRKLRRQSKKALPELLHILQQLEVFAGKKIDYSLTNAQRASIKKRRANLLAKYQEENKNRWRERRKRLQLVDR